MSRLHISHTEIDYDDCYCPAGVMARNEASVNAAMFGLIALALAACIALAMIIKLIIVAVASFSIAGALLGLAVPTIASCMGLWALSYAIQQVHKYKDGKWVWLPVRGYKAIKAIAWKKAIVADLEQRFDERPELSTLTVMDVLASERDGHHAGEVLPDAEFEKIYADAFVAVKQRVAKQTYTASRCDN